MNLGSLTLSIQISFKIYKTIDPTTEIKSSKKVYMSIQITRVLCAFLYRNWAVVNEKESRAKFFFFHSPSFVLGASKSGHAYAYLVGRSIQSI